MVGKVKEVKIEDEVIKIPEEWEVVTFGKLMQKIVGGGTPSRKITDYWNGNIHWATVKDLIATQSTGAIEKISQLGLKNSSSNLIPKNTLIIATRMGLGKIIKFSCDVAINQDLKALFPSSKLINDYLFYWYQNKADEIENMGSGSTVKGIRLEALSGLSFFLPPLPEQKKIAEIFTSVDSAIETTLKVIDQTEKMKKGLLQEFLTRGIGHDKFKKVKMGNEFVEIPEEWEVVSLIELSQTGITNGVFNDPQKVGRGYKLINVVNLYSEPYIETKNLSKLELSKNEFQKYKVEKGDLFFTRSSLKLGGIAHCNIYDENEDDIVFECHIMRIRPKNKIANPYFLRFYFISQVARNYFMSRAKQVTMTTISQSDIDKMSVPLPPLPEQKQITEVLTSVDDKIIASQNELEQLQTFKKGLMQDLLTGKLRVKI